MADSTSVIRRQPLIASRSKFRDSRILAICRDILCDVTKKVCVFAFSRPTGQQMMSIHWTSEWHFTYRRDNFHKKAKETTRIFGMFKSRIWKGPTGAIRDNAKTSTLVSLDIDRRKWPQLIFCRLVTDSATTFPQSTVEGKTRWRRCN